MHAFTVVFLVAVTASLATRLWLTGRQIRHVARNRDAVPAEFSAVIPLERHRLAADYTIERARFGRIDVIIETLLLLIWTIGGGIAAIDGAWRSLGLGPVATGAGVLITVVGISALIDVPLRAWRTFVIEQRFGFNHMPPGLFIADHLRAAGVMLALGLPLAALVVWLMQTGHPWWWLWVWAVWLLFNLTMIWGWPRFIAPLFHRFEPLQDANLRARIEGLAERCGFRSRSIHVIDGSRRSSHGNAYFTGFGRNRRIVFFDTLLARLTDDEIEAVLAHELGHFRRGHVTRMIAASALGSLIALALLAWSMHEPWIYRSLGVPAPSAHTSLLVFLLAAPVVMFFLKPLLARLSRRHELEADAFAAQQCPPANLIAALTRLYSENATTLTPDRLHSAFHDSHPPALERIARLRALDGRTEAGAGDHPFEAGAPGP